MFITTRVRLCALFIRRSPTYPRPLSPSPPTHRAATPRRRCPASGGQCARRPTDAMPMPCRAADTAVQCRACRRCHAATPPLLTDARTGWSLGFSCAIRGAAGLLRFAGPLRGCVFYLFSGGGRAAHQGYSVRNHYVLEGPCAALRATKEILILPSTYNIQKKTPHRSRARLVLLELQSGFLFSELSGSRHTHSHRIPVCYWPSRSQRTVSHNGESVAELDAHPLQLLGEEARRAMRTTEQEPPPPTST